MARIAVVGGGIAGLGAAWELTKGGHQVVVLERGSVAGGRMQTRTEAGFTWDCGPQFMLTNYTYMQRLMTELGVPFSRHPIPGVMANLLPDGRRYYGSPSPLSVLRHPALALATKLRLWKVLAAAAKHRHLFDFHQPEKMAAIDTESLRAWGDREIGADGVDYLLSLPASALFFWRADQTPWWFPAAYSAMMQAHHVQVPVGGMGAVPLALARRLDVSYHTRVEQVRVLPGNSVSLTAISPSGQEELVVDRVIIATPAPVTIGMLADPDGAIGKARAEYLRTARYVANTTTAVAYQRAPETRAYGVGVPLALNRPLAAIGWEQMKGPDRVPAGAGLGVMMPTDDFSAKVWKLPNEQIGAQLVDAAEAIYPGSKQSVLFHRVFHHQYAMPIFAPGRFAALAQVRSEPPAPGTLVFPCGDYWLGPDTERALLSGLQAAADLMASLDIP